MSVNPNMANRDVCNAIFRDYKTSKVKYNFNRANVTTTELTGETTPAYGGQHHVPRIYFSGDKKGTMEFETQIQPFILYEMVSGADVTTNANLVVKETATTTTEKPTITLTSAPVANSVITVFKAGTTATEVPATYTATTVTLTTPTPGNYDVYYVKSFTTDVKRLNIKSTTFGKAYNIQMETYNITEDDEVVPYKMTAYKATPQPNFTIKNSSSGDAATFTMKFDLASDKDDNLLDMVIIEEDQRA